MRPSGAGLGDKKVLQKFPWCQIVRGVKLSVFTHSVKLSGVKLSTVSNCPVSNCPGVKLSANMGGVKLSAVSNCPGVLGPFYGFTLCLNSALISHCSDLFPPC